MILFLVLAGCGRIWFDAQPDASVDAEGQCDIAAPFTSTRMLAELASPVGDGGLRLSDDELTAYFHSSRDNGAKLFTASRTSREAPFDAPVASGFGALWPTALPGGLTVVFAQINGASYDLFSRSRATTSEPFMPRIEVGGVNTPGSTETAAAFADGGQWLYFSRVTTSEDLFVAAWPPTSAQPLAELNTAGDESAPAPSHDHLTMYFRRNDGTTSTDDILVARRASTGEPFGGATPVAELNTAADESPTWLSPDQCRLYFERNEMGEFDLFVAERTP